MRFTAAFILALGVSAVRVEELTELSAEEKAEEEAEMEWRRKNNKRNRKQRGCPRGLTRHHGYCRQDNPQVPQVEIEPGFEMSWAAPETEPPLFFRKRGGSFMLEHHFIQEVMAATSDVGVSHKIYNDFIENEEAINPSFTEESSAFIAAVKELGEQANTYYEGGRTRSNSSQNLASEFFRGIKETLDKAGGVVEGNQVRKALVNKVFGSVNGSAHTAITWTEDKFDNVFPIMALGAGLEKLWKDKRQQYKDTDELVQSFVAKLAKRSTCVGRQTKMQQVVALDSDFLKDDVYAKCGELVSAQLSRQMYRTNAAFNHLFETMAATGQCLWPSGKKAHNRIRCADALYTPLREVRGEKGLLYEAISFAALYADSADELLSEPSYGDWVHEKFDIQVDAESVHKMNGLWDVEESDTELRAEGCLSVVATQRAFERTFMKLSAALPIWLQTYGRRTTKMGIHTNWRPCKRVFYALDDDESEGMCKPIEDKNFFPGLLHEQRGNSVDVDDACDEEDEEASMGLWSQQ